MQIKEIAKQAQKAGQPPGTLVYTGKEKNAESRITVLTYNSHTISEVTGAHLEKCLSGASEAGVTWVNIEGLNDLQLMEEVSARYKLHHLTVEDVLNVEQRSKVEEFDDYLFITLKVLFWHTASYTFSAEQLSLVIGKDFVLSFQEKQTELFKSIYQRLHADTAQHLRQNGSDYLAYRLIDIIVDQYFVVLEGLGDRIEILEEWIIADPNSKNSHMMYHLKRQIMMLRKAIWPMREAISHLLQAEQAFISPFTRLYLRDVYDHTIQAIDIVETFRDMLEGILSAYLSSVNNRMNEVMKLLTIVATVFIPITFLTGIFGMNFKYMPELDWRWGYYTVLGGMLLIALIMLHCFRRKKWI